MTECTKYFWKVSSQWWRHDVMMTSSNFNSVKNRPLQLSLTIIFFFQILPVHLPWHIVFEPREGRALNQNRVRGRAAGSGWFFMSLQNEVPYVPFRATLIFNNNIESRVSFPMFLTFQKLSQKMFFIFDKKKTGK